MEIHQVQIDRVNILTRLSTTEEMSKAPSCVFARPCDYCDGTADLSVYANLDHRIFRTICRSCAASMEYSCSV